MGRSNYRRTKRKSTRAHAKRKSIRTRAHAKRKSIRKSTRRQQNGGRSTFLPSDMVNMTRTMSSGVGGVMGAIKGVELAAHPGPTLGQFPISR
jgi:hypothetical protein